MYMWYTITMVNILKKTSLVKTQYGTFEAVFEHETDRGGYVVTAPRVRGGVSWGKNLSEAKKMIVEAIECSIEGEVILAAETAGQVTISRQMVPSFA